jgi:hypothetical protein
MAIALITQSKKKSQEICGDRNDYNLYRNQSIHAANQVLFGQSTVIDKTSQNLAEYQSH